MPISKGYLTKITAEKARRERPDFIAPALTNEVQEALVGKPLEKATISLENGIASSIYWYKTASTNGKIQAGKQYNIMPGVNR